MQVNKRGRKGKKMRRNAMAKSTTDMERRKNRKMHHHSCIIPYIPCFRLQPPPLTTVARGTIKSCKLFLYKLNLFPSHFFTFTLSRHANLFPHPRTYKHFPFFCFSNFLHFNSAVDLHKKNSLRYNMFS